MNSQDKKNLVSKLSSSYSIRITYRTLNINKSTISREVSETKSNIKRAECIPVIRKIYEESSGVYGLPKIHSDQGSKFTVK